MANALTPNNPHRVAIYGGLAVAGVLLLAVIWHAMKSRGTAGSQPQSVVAQPGQDPTQGSDVLATASLDAIQQQLSDLEQQLSIASTSAGSSAPSGGAAALPMSNTQYPFPATSYPIMQSGVTYAAGPAPPGPRPY